MCAHAYLLVCWSFTRARVTVRVHAYVFTRSVHVYPFGICMCMEDYCVCAYVCGARVTVRVHVYLLVLREPLMPFYPVRCVRGGLLCVHIPICWFAGHLLVRGLLCTCICMC